MANDRAFAAAGVTRSIAYELAPKRMRKRLERIVSHFAKAAQRTRQEVASR